ncbi:MAG: hypothetical protein AB2598_09220 [Candidatus Thiodiazotropha sp.]
MSLFELLRRGLFIDAEVACNLFYPASIREESRQSGPATGQAAQPAHPKTGKDPVEGYRISLWIIPAAGSIRKPVSV